jgi:hypothetical protein
MKPVPDTQRTMAVAEIRIGKRHRRDLGDIAPLATSIADVGLLHPVVVKPDGTLIAGERRLRACQSLGWSDIPVTLVPLADIVRGELAENVFRKNFLPTEIYAIWQALEPLERAAAKKRQGTRNDLVENFHNVHGGKTRDRIAACAGISGRTLDKIAAVMEAAEADPRRRPLVDLMDQTGSVSRAFQQLESIKAEVAAPRKAGKKSAVQISVAAWNAAFPKYPALFEDKGCIYGVWYTGTAWHKSRLHGEFPPNFLKRALALFPGAQEVLHCPSGTVVGPGTTIDRVRDKVRCPQIVADAAALPIQSGTIDLVLSDPPYSDEDSKIYDCPPFPQKRFMSEARRVLRRGGYLGVLHLYLPPYRKSEWKLVGIICIITAPSRSPRIFSIFKRL